MQKLFVASQDIPTILKSINWNSNNYAANQLFMAAGGLSRFRKLYYHDFNQTEDDVVFVNGSGQNHYLMDGTQAVNSGSERLYNKATCRNVLRTMLMLNKAIQSQKLELQDIMSVVGSDKLSTVGGATYSNALTTGSVVAKTGTVGTNVTLAGLAYTKKGPRYFMYNAELGYAPKRFRNKKAWKNQEENRARRMISIELQNLIKTNGGSAKFKYDSQNPLGDNLENYDEESLTEAAALSPADKAP